VANKLTEVRECHERCRLLRELALTTNSPAKRDLYFAMAKGWSAMAETYKEAAD
jgi:hypothetical protein